MKNYDYMVKTKQEWTELKKKRPFRQKFSQGKDKVNQIQLSACYNQ